MSARRAFGVLLILAAIILGQFMIDHASAVYDALACRPDLTSGVMECFWGDDFVSRFFYKISPILPSLILTFFGLALVFGRKAKAAD